MACPPGGPHSGYFVCTLHTLHIHTSRPNGHGPPTCGTRFPGDLPAQPVVQLFTRSSLAVRRLPRCAGPRAATLGHRAARWSADLLRGAPPPRRRGRSGRPGHCPRSFSLRRSSTLYSYVPYHSSRRDAVGPWGLGVAQRSVLTWPTGRACGRTGGSLYSDQLPPQDPRRTHSQYRFLGSSN